MEWQRQTASAPVAGYSDFMYGWTFHQSHDQATVLFLVPHQVSAEDLNIQIEKDFVIAAVRGRPAILKAKLYGRINRECSTWRIDERDKGRSKRRSRSLTRPEKSSSSDEATSSTGKRTRDVAGVNAASPASDSDESRPDRGHNAQNSPSRSQSSMTASVVSIQSGSSYDVVQLSPMQRSQIISPSSVTGWSSGSSEFAYSDSAEASLSRSVLVSEHDKDTSQGKEGASVDRAYHTRSDSSNVSGGHPSEDSEPDSGRSRREQGMPHTAGGHEPPEARLVTLHLEKIDSGIWPFLVVGPAPLQLDCLSSRLRKVIATKPPPDTGLTEAFLAGRVRAIIEERQDRMQKDTAQLQLNQALVEALGNFQGGDRMLASFRRGLNSHVRASEGESDEELGPSTSSISINTIGSDESSTVLGSRVAFSDSSTYASGLFAERWQEEIHETEEDEEEFEAWKELHTEAKFNMDPTTLSLIGLQVGKRRLSGSFTDLPSSDSSAGTGIPEAFEHFARSWRTADIGLATERLIHDYLPLLPTHYWLGVSRVDESSHDDLFKFLPSQMLDAATALSDISSKIAPALRERLLKPSYIVQRQRLVASLGGPKALARLYLSYGRLRLPSPAGARSALAFPYGQHTSPFTRDRGATVPRQNTHVDQTGARKATSVSSLGSNATSSKGQASRGAASPKKGADVLSSPLRSNSSQLPSPYQSPPAEMSGGGDFPDFFVGQEHSAETQPGPIYFLLEAGLLDEDLSQTISENEWLEALNLALVDEENLQKELDGIAQAEEMGSLAGDSHSGCLAFDSDSASHTGQRPHRGQRTRRGKNPRRPTVSTSTDYFRFFWPSESTEKEPTRQRDRRSKGYASKSKRRRDRRDPALKQEAGVITLVSGAALLGVALAGSVAALGWWRRAGTLNSVP